MLSDHAYYGPRKPRHRAAGTNRLHLQVERSDDEVARMVDAELVNLSRNGYQLRTSVPLAVHESIILRFHDESSEPTLSLQGVVRWRRAENDSSWLHGCLSTRPIEWETLGELFLQDVLATDR